MATTQMPVWDLEKLKALDDRVALWKLFDHLGEQERHFNQLQAGYRVTASGWLLATLGAIGLVAIQFPDANTANLLVCGIAAAGAIGIYLLWVVDILVYHRLLDACFVEGLKLERVLAEIPPTRHNMMRMLSDRGVLFRIVGYYLGPIVLLMLISGGGLVLHLRSSNPMAAMVVALATSLLALFASLLLYEKTANSDQFVALLQNDSREPVTSRPERRRLGATLKDFANAAPVVLMGLLACAVTLAWLAADRQPAASLVTNRLPPRPDYLAPDTSEVRLLARGARGSLAHFTLPPGQTSKPVAHKTVEEVWYFVGGKGEMWRRLGSQDEIVEVSAGTSINIPPGASFQFRTSGEEALQAVAITMPPWPGADEATPVSGKW